MPTDTHFHPPILEDGVPMPAEKFVKRPKSSELGKRGEFLRAMAVGQSFVADWWKLSIFAAAAKAAGVRIAYIRQRPMSRSATYTVRIWKTD